MDWIFILLAATSGILFTAGDVFLKLWAESSRFYYVLVALFVYVIATIALGYSFKREKIAIAVAVLICFNLITVAFVGFTYFQETLGLKEVIGISLALLAVILLNV